MVQGLRQGSVRQGGNETKFTRMMSNDECEKVCASFFSFPYEIFHKPIKKINRVCIQLNV